MTADGAETLTIRDRDMIEAIAALAAPRPRRPAGPSRGGGSAGAARRPRGHRRARRRRRAADPRPRPRGWCRPRRAAELGDRLLIALVERGGPPCADPDAAARARYPRRPPRPRRAAAPAPRPLGPARAALLPGTTLVLDPDLVRAAPPEVIAGWVALALERDPLADLLAAAGPLASLRLLAGGDPGDAALARAADALAAAPAAPPPLPAVDLDPRQAAALAAACR